LDEPCEKAPGRRFHLYRGLSWKRLALIVALGAVAVVMAQRYLESKRPPLVPADVAEKCRKELGEALAAVASSRFAQTERGRILTREVQRYLDAGRIQFSHGMGKQALFRKELLRRPVIYINVPIISGRHIPPDRVTMVEAVYHELLHAIQSRSCYEEECDAFVAAAQAEAALEHTEPEFPILRDGQPLGKWVRAAYPNARPDPAYAPLGHDREWLLRAIQPKP